MMIDQNSNSEHRNLPVINPNDKVEQLRRESSGSSVPATGDETLVSRFLAGDKTPQQKAIIEKAIEAIRQVYDPEIPVNIYDLGLIYGIEVDPQTLAVHVTMTLTAPGCPVAGSLVGEVEQRVENISEVKSCTVELTFDPPWTQSMMSEAAQLELGLL